MSRLFAALVSLVVLPAVIAAPVPKHLFPKPLYYPTQKGARWVYLDGLTEHEHLLTDVEKSKSDDATIVTICEVNGEKQTPWRKMAVSSRGLVWVEASGSAFDEPIRMLRCPVTLNDELPYRASGSGIGACKGTMTVIAVEEVKVPAGTFSAVRVEDAFTMANSDKTQRWTYWFVPEVGFVRYDYGDRSMVLKSFVPGKE